MTLFQGGTFRSGFASGFAASFFSPGTTLGGNGAEGFTLRTTVAAVVGGTASEIGGGKFANGAISGAFVHMFNAEAVKVLKRLTFAKAREHYIENSGKPLYVKASSVDLSKVNVSMFSGVGDSKYIYLFFNGNEYSSFNDALVYGTIKVVYAGGNQVGIMPDYYDFDIQDWSLSTVVRNLGTIGGRILNMDPLGMGQGYPIYFEGTATIGEN